MAFRKAGDFKIGGKFLVYGESGTGKSCFGLTFPRSAIVDSETGIAFYEGTDITLNNGKTYNNVVNVDTTADIDTLEEDLDSLLNGEYDNSIDTFIVDSETKFFNTLQTAALEVEESRMKRKGGDVSDAGVSIRSWGRIKLINMKLQRAKLDISSKGFNVVSVAQSVNVLDEAGKKVIEIKPDMYKTVKFDYDTILYFFTKKEGDNYKYFAEVKKDRTRVTKVGQIIENPCYDIWADYFNGRNEFATNQTSFSKAVNTTTESISEESEKVDEIIAEWKDCMKKIKDDGNASAATAINKFIKEKEIDVKKLDLLPIETAQELLDFTKSL